MIGLFRKCLNFSHRMLNNAWDTENRIYEGAGICMYKKSEKNRKNDTVRQRILRSNAWMVFVILLLFLIINVCMIKIYAESIETKMLESVGQIMDEETMEGLVKDWTIHRNEFVVIFTVDGILCVLALIVVSRLFTQKLTGDVMKPLHALTDGANRIRENNLTETINYSGAREFEIVCDTFNDMQQHILSEQEKNQKYEKARTDMIAGISHDLRTPLTAVRGTIKGLLDGIASTPQQQERFLQTAYRRTGDMDVLLNQLFYLSKMESGNLPLAMQTIDLADFIRNYANAKHDQLRDSSEELTVTCGGIDAQVTVDPDQLYRIFDNLIENSRKYAQADPLRIKIELCNCQNGVMVTVSDNGVGVPDDKLPYIFDEFYRADESRNKKEGNGLGLYIVKHLIEAMGGSVRAENENGLTVLLELPLAHEGEGAL